MVDPKFATVYNRTPSELEEFAIFSVCVAGKNAHNTAKSVSKMVYYLDNLYPEETPLFAIDSFFLDRKIEDVEELVRSVGIGCKTRVSHCLTSLARKVVHNPEFLYTCSPADLESIPGIGSKTARFFILHTRPNQRIAALDVHILHYLRDNGIAAPKSTPPKGSAKYKELEEVFLTMCERHGKDYAEMDLWVWNRYSRDGLDGNSKRAVDNSTKYAGTDSSNACS